MVKYTYKDEASVHVSLFKVIEDDTSQEVELLTDTTDITDITDTTDTTDTTGIPAPTDPSSVNAMMMDRVLISKATGL